MTLGTLLLELPSSPVLSILHPLSPLFTHHCCSNLGPILKIIYFLITMTTEIPNDEEQRKQLLAVSTAVLSQAIDLVEKRLTSDDQLLVHAKHLPGSTIGVYLTSL
jgi:hypothetical protein